MVCIEGDDMERLWRWRRLDGRTCLENSGGEVRFDENDGLSLVC